MDHAASLPVLDAPILQRYLSAFAGATGILLRYLPAVMSRAELSEALQKDPFTTMIMLTSKGESACIGPILNLSNDVIRSLQPSQSSKVCGFTHLGVPLVLAGSTIGILMAGPMVPRVVTLAGSAKITRQLKHWGSKLTPGSIRVAYGAVPIVSSMRLESATALLSILADQLAGERWLLCERGLEPRCVTSAKLFMDRRAIHELAVNDVAHHVCLSADHIGKIFKKHTHMTMGQYLAGVRIDHVKQLLAVPSNRVIEAAFTAGFHSLAQFNRVFKKHVGVNPTQYRALRGHELRNPGKHAAKPAR